MLPKELPYIASLAFKSKWILFFLRILNVILSSYVSGGDRVNIITSLLIKVIINKQISINLSQFSANILLEYNLVL